MGAGNLLWSLSGAKSPRKQLEQSVVTWEEDASVVRCPFCQQEFSSYTFRRHHCRLCGRIVCGDPLTDCSKEIGINVESSKYMPLPQTLGSDCSSIEWYHREGHERSRSRCKDVQKLPEYGLQQTRLCCCTCGEAS